MEEEVFEKTGLVEKKEECLTKKGNAYWKFTIEGKTFNLFEYEAGENVRVGDNAKIVWTEKEGTYQGADVTYKNLKSIFPIEGGIPQKEAVSGTNAEEVKSSSYDSYRNGQRVGMIMNNAVAIAVAENKPTRERIEFWFNTLEVFIREKEK